MTFQNPLRNPRVAIVDDDIIWQKLLVFALQRFGVEVRTFSSAQSVWDFIQRHPSHFHCFLLDFHLQPGGWNGGQLAKELRNREKAPIAFLSTAEEIEEVAQKIPSAVAISKRLPFESICESLKSFLSQSVAQPN